MAVASPAPTADGVAAAVDAVEGAVAVVPVVAMPPVPATCRAMPPGGCDDSDALVDAADSTKSSWVRAVDAAEPPSESAPLVKPRSSFVSVSASL